MAYEQRELSGSIFKNDKKTEDKHPNGQGRCLIGGVEYYISAWTKEGAKGKWQSLAFKPVNEQAAPTSRQPQAPGFPDDDSDIPF